MLSVNRNFIHFTFAFTRCPMLICAWRTEKYISRIFIQIFARFIDCSVSSCFIRSSERFFLITSHLIYWAIFLFIFNSCYCLRFISADKRRDCHKIKVWGGAGSSSFLLFLTKLILYVGFNLLSMSAKGSFSLSSKLSFVVYSYTIVLTLTYRSKNLGLTTIVKPY
jgi:hypothetical protein